MTIYAYLLRMQISVKYRKRKLTWVDIASSLITWCLLFSFVQKGSHHLLPVFMSKAQRPSIYLQTQTCVKICIHSSVNQHLAYLYSIGAVLGNLLGHSCTLGH